MAVQPVPTRAASLPRRRRLPALPLPTVALPTYQRLAVLAAVALALIVVTGGAVRLTGSGLGCPSWPRCTLHSYVAPAAYHPMVEFVNRVISGSVGLLVAAVAVAAVRVDRRRRALLVPAWGLVAGVAGQAVLGGLTVLYKLSPPWVMAHFLLSMLVLWDALLLVHRAAPGWSPHAPSPVRAELRWLTRLLMVVAGGVLVLGTVTTGTGPHAGSPGTPRLHLPLERVTQLHADAALLLTGLVVATLVALRVAAVPPHVARLARWLAVVIGAQVAVGYAQYFLDLPPGLVMVHIAGATALWSVTVLLNLAVAGRNAPVARNPAPATAAAG